MAFEYQTNKLNYSVHISWLDYWTKHCCPDTVWTADTSEPQNKFPRTIKTCILLFNSQCIQIRLPRNQKKTISCRCIVMPMLGERPLNVGTFLPSDVSLNFDNLQLCSTVLFSCTVSPPLSLNEEGWALDTIKVVEGWTTADQGLDENNVFERCQVHWSFSVRSPSRLNDWSSWLGFEVTFSTLLHSPVWLDGDRSLSQFVVTSLSLSLAN